MCVSHVESIQPGEGVGACASVYPTMFSGQLDVLQHHHRRHTKLLKILRHMSLSNPLGPDDPLVGLAPMKSRKNSNLFLPQLAPLSENKTFLKLSKVFLGYL